MGRQLDIIALEPYYGGVRKDTVELLARHSRHRWTVFKLPARRMERRVMTAAQWFHQQIARVSKIRCDVLFVGETMNLAEFQRLVPDYGRKPSVAYFYSNPLLSEAAAEQVARLAMLGTANSATETWFSSLFHLRSFLSSAGSILAAHPELGGKQQIRSLIAKSQLIHPPVEIAPPDKDADVVDAERKGRTVCLDNREPGASDKLFGEVLKRIAARREPIAVHVLGKELAEVPSGVPVVMVDPKRPGDVVRMFRRCELFVTAALAENFDPLAMRAMALGCIPILPKAGFYGEFLPKSLHASCLFEPTPEELLSKVMDMWYLRRPAVARRDLDIIFDRYTPQAATKSIDRRLELLVKKAKGEA